MKSQKLFAAFQAVWKNIVDETPAEIIQLLRDAGLIVYTANELHALKAYPNECLITNGETDPSDLCYYYEDGNFYTIWYGRHSTTPHEEDEEDGGDILEFEEYIAHWAEYEDFPAVVCFPS